MNWKCIWFSILILGLSSFSRGQAHRYVFEHPQMGTIFRILLYAEDSTLAAKASSAAFRRIDTLNNRLSDYWAESELNALSSSSGTGQCRPVSSDIWHVLAASLQLYTESKGAFDVTVGPLVQLWRRARRKSQLPDSKMVKKARQAVGSQYIKMDRSTQCVKLTRSGMRLDLGGIAKGFAVDEAMAVLRKFGIAQALVDGGGDLLAGEAPPGSQGWRVSLKMKGPNGLLADSVMFIAHKAIASSGDTYRYIEIDGIRYSHILNPKTGLGLTRRRRVTTIAHTAMLADAWASALSVLGPKKGKKLLRKHPNLDALMLEQYKGSLSEFRTKGFVK